MRFPVFLVPFAVVLFCANAANAMSCWQPSPQEHIEKAELIFFGEVVAGGATTADHKVRTVTFKVLRAYKGINSSTISIKYMNDLGGNTGWGFRPGSATLVFARSDKNSSEAEPLGTLNYCNMIPYHARTRLHPAYWDILAKRK